MDINSTVIITKGVSEGILSGFLYDLLKMSLAFLIVKVVYDQWFMKWKWGGWKVLVYEENICMHEEEIASQSANRILNDRREFSVYIKGIVSPYAWLNLDVGSKDAEEKGLTERDSKNKQIIINIDKNPRKKIKEKVEFTKETQNQIDFLCSQFNTDTSSNINMV